MMTEEESDFWLLASESSLAEVWDNSQDDAFPKLLDEG